jgi:hypothetical protein
MRRPASRFQGTEMNYVAATSEYGMVVRKLALEEKGMPRSTLLEIMADIDILGENEAVISFGPLFGEEALKEIMTRLSASKLEYVDDFVELNFLLPEWVKLGITAA